MTQDYSTKTHFLPRKNYMPNSHWGIALDIGYSAVKGMSPNMAYCFPSYAKPFTGTIMSVGEARPDEIQFKAEDGTVWEVGASAQRLIRSNETNDIHNLYNRNRYLSPMFKVLALTGLGIGMRDNEHSKPNNKVITLQTGLPPAYLRDDVPMIKEVLAGRHHFSLKVGNEPWQDFDFELPVENIRVMAQPMGSYLSAIYNNEARFIPMAKDIFTSKVMVFDGGFGTLDLYTVNQRKIEHSQSLDDLGMKAVFEETSKVIRDKFGESIPVYAMQKNLIEGKVRVFNRRNMTETLEDFDDILAESSKKICMKAIDRMKDNYDYLRDYDYLLVTGGIGAAWYDIIADHFKNMRSLNIVSGSQNDTLSHIYSNVRGYYMYQADHIRGPRVKK